MYQGIEWLLSFSEWEGMLVRAEARWEGLETEEGVEKGKRPVHNPDWSSEKNCDESV